MPWTQAAVDLDPGVGGVQWSFQVENSESNIYLDEIGLSRTACESYINTSRGNIYLLLSYELPLPVNYSASIFDNVLACIVLIFIILSRSRGLLPFSFVCTPLLRFFQIILNRSYSRLRETAK